MIRNSECTDSELLHTVALDVQFVVVGNSKSAASNGAVEYLREIADRIERGEEAGRILDDAGICVGWFNGIADISEAAGSENA